MSFRDSLHGFSRECYGFQGSVGLLICEYQNFCSSQKKNRISAQKRPILAQNMHFWSFGAKYCHFLHILSNARPKNYMNKVPRWVFRYVGNKTFDFSSKKKDFLPKNDQIWPKTGIFGQFGPGHAGFFGALLVGRLVDVARGLYLARHLFTLYIYSTSLLSIHDIQEYSMATFSGPRLLCTSDPPSLGGWG